MHYTRLIFLSLVTLLMPMFSVIAQEGDSNIPVPDSIIVDGQDFVNDPRTVSDANACYEGGALEGKCNTTDVDMDGDIDRFDIDWMWTGGWYRIRWDFGMLERNVLNTFQLGDILPEEFVFQQETVQDETPVSACTHTSTARNQFYVYNGDSLIIYTDSSCTQIFFFVGTGYSFTAGKGYNNADVIAVCPPLGVGTYVDVDSGLFFRCN